MPFPSLCLGSPGLLDLLPLPAVWVRGSMMGVIVDSGRAGWASNPVNTPGVLIEHLL